MVILPKCKKPYIFKANGVWYARLNWDGVVYKSMSMFTAKDAYHYLIENLHSHGIKTSYEENK